MSGVGEAGAIQAIFANIIINYKYYIIMIGGIIITIAGIIWAIYLYNNDDHNGGAWTLIIVILFLIVGALVCISPEEY